MQNTLRFFLCVSLLITMCLHTYGQKYGHVNLGNLMTKMPEVETGSSQLVKYNEQLVAQLQQKVDDWERRYKELERLVPTLPPVEVKEREQKLLEEQQKILQEEQLITLKVNEKRAEIMGPIIQKVQESINAIGKENGYTMIFDTSVPNTVLYVDDSIDLTDQVLTRLGIK